MCCNHKSVDLSLLNDVLEHYADVKGSLIFILQKTQEIYGYIPIDAVYHIAEQTGSTPAKVLGVAITKADERKNYFHQTVETLRSLEGVKLFETFIRIDSSIEWAQDNSKPVMAYKKSSRAAQEYMEMAKEIMKYADR